MIRRKGMLAVAAALAGLAGLSVLGRVALAENAPSFKPEQKADMQRVEIDLLALAARDHPDRAVI